MTVSYLIHSLLGEPSMESVVLEFQVIIILPGNREVATSFNCGLIDHPIIWLVSPVV